jgi:hypothetical protein
MGAQVSNRAPLTVWSLVVTTSLPVEHKNLVIVIDLLGIPFDRELGFRYSVGRPHG